MSLRQARHVARMVKWEMRKEFWMDSFQEKDHSEDLDVDVR
jgi:hypothetical protein